MDGAFTGQIVLGFRSLLVKLAIFIIMAALLAWALGGTLWPRPKTETLSWYTLDDLQWAWQISVGHSDGPSVRWHLGTSEIGKFKFKPISEQIWLDRTRIVSDGQRLVTAARRVPDPTGVWVVLDISADGVTETAVRDRLEAERVLHDLEVALRTQSSPTSVSSDQLSDSE